MKQLRIDEKKCNFPHCDQVCTSIMGADFYHQKKKRINEWSLKEHGRGYQNIYNTVKHCEFKAVILEDI